MHVCSNPRANRGRSIVALAAPKSDVAPFCLVNQACHDKQHQATERGWTSQSHPPSRRLADVVAGSAWLWDSRKVVSDSRQPARFLEAVLGKQRKKSISTIYQRSSIREAKRRYRAAKASFSNRSSSVVVRPSASLRKFNLFASRLRAELRPGSVHYSFWKRKEKRIEVRSASRICLSPLPLPFPFEAFPFVRLLSARSAIFGVPGAMVRSGDLF